MKQKCVCLQGPLLAFATLSTLALTLFALHNQLQELRDQIDDIQDEISGMGQLNTRLTTAENLLSAVNARSFAVCNAIENAGGLTPVATGGDAADAINGVNDLIAFFDDINDNTCNNGNGLGTLGR